MNFKQKTFDVIQPDCGGSTASRIFDWTITTLIVVSVVTVFAVTFDLPERVKGILATVESMASFVFTIEYLARIWTADKLYPTMGGFRARIRYVISGMAVIDLLAILPFWLPMIFPGAVLGVRALRLIRLLRILKLNRYFDALRSLVDVITSKKRELVGSVFFVILLMLVSSLLMYAAEHDAQPTVFRNAFSGLWWAVATLTTVGYGDIYPVTVLGRILGALIAFSGLAALAIPTGIITSGLMERVDRKEQGANSFCNDAECKSLLAQQAEMLKRISTSLESMGMTLGEKK